MFAIAGLNLAQRLAGLVAPPVCALCGGAGQSLDETWGLDLCSYCESACPGVPDPCPRCGEPLAAGRGCHRCRDHPPPFDAVHGLFLYADPVDQMITGLKFRHELVFARVLGTLFGRALRNRPLPLPDCIVPMPLHRTRYIERGFNQTAEIARHVAGRTGIPVHSRILERCRATLPQSGLDAAARRHNMADAFSVCRDNALPRRIAVLDDVMTTGHTAAAAALALKDSGCRHVEIWACARALRSALPLRPEAYGE